MNTLYRAIDLDSHEGISILKELASGGNNILLVGSAISMWEPTSIPTGKSLSEEISMLLAQQVGVSEKTQLITEYISSTPFEYINNQCPKPEILKQILPSMFFPVQSNSIHRSIAKLVRDNIFSSIITTNYDNGLEDALKKNNPLSLVVTNKDYKKELNNKRILFKIHGSADPFYKDSIVFRLEQEGEMEQWKSKLLHKLVKNKNLIVLGYSGADFEICPEIISSDVNKIVWISLESGENIRHNAHRVLTEKKGTLLIGDLRIALKFLGASPEKTFFSTSTFKLSENLKEHLSDREFSFWACSVLGPPGYARYAERIAQRVYDSANQDTFEKAMASYYLGVAIFSRGWYLKTAKYTMEASNYFLRNRQFKLYTSSETQGVDALRCAGYPGWARKRLNNARKVIESQKIINRNQFITAFDLKEILILRDEFVRINLISRIIPWFFNKQKKSKQTTAKELLIKVANKSAATGQWHDFQQCRMWATRLDISFAEIYTGSLIPPEEIFGWKQLGHKVPELMALRDKLSKEGKSTVSKDIILENIEIADDIGCDPEVWKLSLALLKHFFHLDYHFTVRWIRAFFRCEYSPVMRIIKIASENS